MQHLSDALQNNTVRQIHSLHSSFDSPDSIKTLTKIDLRHNQIGEDEGKEVIEEEKRNSNSKLPEAEYMVNANGNKRTAWNVAKRKLRSLFN